VLDIVIFKLLETPSLPDGVFSSYRYCDPLNFWLLEHTSEPDPAGQLEWLLHVLWGAEKAGERVIILVSHIRRDGCLLTPSAISGFRREQGGCCVSLAGAVSRCCRSGERRESG
jgi:hypothetical protein